VPPIEYTAGAAGAAVRVGMIVYRAVPLELAATVPVPSMAEMPESRAGWTKNRSLAELPAASRKSSVTWTFSSGPVVLPLFSVRTPLKAARVSVACWSRASLTRAQTPSSDEADVVGAESRPPVRIGAAQPPTPTDMLAEPPLPRPLAFPLPPPPPPPPRKLANAESVQAIHEAGTPITAIAACWIGRLAQRCR